MDYIPIPLDTIRAAYNEIGRLVYVDLRAQLGNRHQECLNLVNLVQQHCANIPLDEFKVIESSLHPMVTALDQALETSNNFSDAPPPQITQRIYAGQHGRPCIKIDPEILETALELRGGTLLLGQVACGSLGIRFLVGKYSRPMLVSTELLLLGLESVELNGAFVTYQVPTHCGIMMVNTVSLDGRLSSMVLLTASRAWAPNAIDEHGLPSRICGNHGTENILVCAFMEAARGLIGGPIFLAGPINQDVMEWAQAWNDHTIAQHLECGTSPRNMFFFGMLTHGVCGDYPQECDEQVNDIDAYGIDWDDFDQPKILNHHNIANPIPSGIDPNPFLTQIPMHLNHVEVKEPTAPITQDQLANL
ncbi:hypothetical protein B0H34DRAFT_670912 [Crassisporium funariophilum]|nr:hypothetical protein B0H34DRAFT_670912 [Crassisporium funariophilum]